MPSPEQLSNYVKQARSGPQNRWGDGGEGRCESWKKSQNSDSRTILIPQLRRFIADFQNASFKASESQFQHARIGSMTFRIRLSQP